MQNRKITPYDFYDPFQNVSTSGRWLRAVVGSLLIGSVFMVEATPLGWLAVLPLIGIYPVATAITGFDPIYRLLAIMTQEKPRVVAPQTTSASELSSQSVSRAA